MHTGALFSIASTAPCGRLILQARLSAKQDRHYSSLGAVPGNNLELQAVDEERFTAAALFGLAGTEEGLQALLQQEGQVLTGMKQQCRMSAIACGSFQYIAAPFADVLTYDLPSRLCALTADVYLLDQLRCGDKLSVFTRS